MPTIGPASYDRITSWFERSGGLPKTLALHSNNSECSCWERPQACYSSNPVLTRLLAEGPALHHLTLRCRSVKCLRNWITLIQIARRNAINSLQIIFAEVAWTDAADASQSVFKHLPPATSLYLELPSVSYAFEGYGVSVPFGLRIPPPVLHGLESLTLLCDWQGTQVVDVLRHCTNLQTLEVGWVDEQEPLSSPVVLASLLTLRVRNAEQIDFLRHIQTPKLRDLDVELIQSEATWATPSQELGDFITTSNIGGVLKSLRMCGITSTGDALALALNRLSSLRHLTLDGVMIPDPEVFWPLLWLRGPGPRLKKLDLLELSDTYPFDVVVDLFNRLPEGVLCDVTVSYSEEGRKDRWSQGDFKASHLRTGRLFFRVIPPLSLSLE